MIRLQGGAPGYIGVKIWLMDDVRIDFTTQRWFTFFLGHLLTVI
jgi:hypothetical protein